MYNDPIMPTVGNIAEVLRELYGEQTVKDIMQVAIARAERIRRESEAQMDKLWQEWLTAAYQTPPKPWYLQP